MRDNVLLVRRARALTWPLLFAAIVLTALPASASVPPVSALSVSNGRGVIVVSWTPSSTTASANVCHKINTPPAVPTEAGAACSGNLTNLTVWSFGGLDGATYGVSVFAYEPATGEYSAPVSATIVASNPPPLPPTGLRSATETTSAGTRVLVLRWSDNFANDDTGNFLVSWAPGLATPGLPDDDQSHVTASTVFKVASLQNGVVYTFAVRARDLGDNVGPPAVLHVSLRRPGLYMRVTGGAASVVKTDILADAGIHPDAAAAYPPGGRLCAAFVTSVRYWTYNAALSTYGTSTEAGYETELYGAVRSASGGWDERVLADLDSGMRHPLIAALPKFEVWGWTSTTGIHVVTTSGDRSTKAVRISANKTERLVGLATDAAHRVHALVLRTAGPGAGLGYVTRAHGVTVRSFVSGTGPRDVGLLTRDPATGRIVVVDAHPSATKEAIRVKAVPATATSVGRLPLWLSTTNHAVQWTPTQVAANGGRITVGVERATTNGARSGDGPYVISGTATSHASPVRLRGTGPADTNLTVSAPRRDQVILSWQRHDARWSPEKLGVWQSRRSLATGIGWTFSRPRHWSTSAYDVPTGAFADSGGHLYIVYVRSDADPIE